MPSQAEIKQERQKALRALRREQRAADTEMEKMERRIFRLFKRKTWLDAEDALSLAAYWKRFIDKARRVEKALGDFYVVVKD